MFATTSTDNGGRQKSKEGMGMANKNMSLLGGVFVARFLLRSAGWMAGWGKEFVHLCGSR